MQDCNGIDLAATGENLHRLRLEHGFRVHDLQMKFGISFQAVYKWERGDGLPSIEVLLALAKLYGSTVEESLVQQKAELSSDKT